MEEALIKRIPPHSPEAEKSVIGSMLMSRDAALAAMEILNKEDFYEQQYGILFEAMKDLNDAGKPIDVVTLQDRLREMDVPPEVADMAFWLPFRHPPISGLMRRSSVRRLRSAG